MFAFGESGEAQLFFTRRIGLDAENQPVPIIGGVKVYGREGPLRFAPFAPSLRRGYSATGDD